MFHQYNVIYSLLDRSFEFLVWGILMHSPYVPVFALSNYLDFLSMAHDMAGEELVSR